MSDCHDSGSSVSVLPPAPASKGASAAVIAIIGPPNSGKSTLFNRLTGLRQKVANFPGVTVEQRTGRLKLANGREAHLIDLPGLYSLAARSEDEQITHDVLKGLRPGIPRPDAIILILDSTNLGRHLLLAPPILAEGLPTLIALNMADDLEGRGGSVDVDKLSEQLGAPVILISASRGDGIQAVTQFLNNAGARKQPFLVLPNLNDIPGCRRWAARASEGAGYHAPAPAHWTRRLDALFLHPLAGPLVFLLVVIAVFTSVFQGAKPLMEDLQAAVDWSGHAVAAQLPDTAFRSLLTDGVWKGVGAVVVFLPQILILFLFIGILEDSGYLARAAVIADRTMARVGLQGKSFIPLLSAYGCAVPAIMATRTIESKRDRIATILIAPFMTCSARLPIYTLMIAAFIPDRAQVATLIGLYVLGFVMAVATAKLLKSTVLKSTRTPFIMEMPPYRWPTVRGLALRLIDRTKVFLRRAGTVILAVAVVLWVLGSLPRKDGQPPTVEASIMGHIGHAVEPAIRPLGFNWKIGVGLIASLAAREVIVGTLGTIYGMEPDAKNEGLQQAVRKDLSFGGAIALLVFFAFAMQCMSTVAVVRRETGGWKWPAIQFAYMTTVAYASAFLANHLF
jgi:ferrous iron transport protein B